MDMYIAEIIASENRYSWNSLSIICNISILIVVCNWIRTNSFDDDLINVIKKKKIVAEESPFVNFYDFIV